MSVSKDSDEAAVTITCYAPVFTDIKVAMKYYKDGKVFATPFYTTEVVSTVTKNLLEYQVVS